MKITFNQYEQIMGKAADRMFQQDQKIEEQNVLIIKMTDMLKRLRKNYPFGSNPVTFAEIDEILQEAEE